MLASCHHQPPFLFSLLSLFLQGSLSRVQLLFLIYYSFLSLPIPLLILTCFIYLPIVSPSPSPCGPVSFHRQPQFPPVFRDYFLSLPPCLAESTFFMLFFPLTLVSLWVLFLCKKQVAETQQIKLFLMEQSSQCGCGASWIMCFACTTWWYFRWHLLFDQF